MNTQVILNEQQEQNRTIKGHEIYINGLVEKINDKEYLVKGKYKIEDLTIEGDINPYFICSCPDNQYRHVRCGHIIATEFYIIGSA